MSDDNPAIGAPSASSVPVFAPITVPVQRSIDSVIVARFLKERERYELEVSAKKVEVSTLKVLPYYVSVDRMLQKFLFYMGKFDEIAKDAATVKNQGIHQGAHAIPDQLADIRPHEADRATEVFLT